MKQLIITDTRDTRSASLKRKLVGLNAVCLFQQPAFFPLSTRSRDHYLATNTPSYRGFPGSLRTASGFTLPVHSSCLESISVDHVVAQQQKLQVTVG